jgi:CRISPR system Cascade subunit CasC
MTRFVQIHTLASYPAALLNRDDAGLAKRMPYGGASRIRISSQCLKRHWRLVDDEWSLKNTGAPMGIRSREIVEREIKPTLKAAESDGKRTGNPTEGGQQSDDCGQRVRAA